MEFNINLDWIVNCAYAPWLTVNYKYNQKLNDLFKNVDFKDCTLIEIDDLYCQIHDEKNGLFIKFWSTNSPYAIACEGDVALTRISNSFSSPTKTVFAWPRSYRPSKYQMGRIARYISKVRKRKTTSDLTSEFFTDGPFLKTSDGKFYEQFQLTEKEWEQKYALYLLKNS